MTTLDPTTPPLLRHDLGETICGQWLVGQRKVGHNYQSYLTEADDDALAFSPSATGVLSGLTPVAPGVLP